MIDRAIRRSAPENGSESGLAGVGLFAGFTALLSAAACCVLPLVLAGVGIGAGGLAAFVPYRWPLAVVALVVVAAGWVLYLRKARVCVSEGCEGSRKRKVTLAMLIVASVLVAISAAWSLFEQPLMRMLGNM